MLSDADGAPTPSNGNESGGTPAHADAAPADDTARVEPDPVPVSTLQPVPVPPPRKESQFRDALNSLQRAKAERSDSGTAASRQTRDLTDDEKRSVAERRQQWRATADRKSSTDGTSDAAPAVPRQGRDLAEDEKRRVAATR